MNSSIHIVKHQFPDKFVGILRGADGEVFIYFNLCLSNRRDFRVLSTFLNVTWLFVTVKLSLIYICAHKLVLYTCMPYYNIQQQVFSLYCPLQLIMYETKYSWILIVFKLCDEWCTLSTWWFDKHAEERRTTTFQW